MTRLSDDNRTHSLRVMLVIEHLQCGGTERQVHHLALNMLAKGILVEVCCLRSLGPFGESLRRRGVPVHLVPKRHKIDVTLPWRLARLFRDRETEVAHLFLFTACTWGGLAARLARVPAVVATDRSIHHLEFNERPVVVTVFRLAARLFHDRMLGNSEQVSQYLQRALKIGSDRVATVLNGIDTIEMNAHHCREEVRQMLEIGDDTPVILMVGRLVWPKNYPLLLRVVVRLREVFPDFITLVVGDGPLQKDLRSYAAVLGISDLVRFLGHRDDVLDLMVAADLVVLTSDVEGFPNALLEAMWLGRATVATDVGGCKEVIVEGETGYLSPPGDEISFATAVEKVLRSPECAARMGEQAHKRVLERFTAERMTEATLVQYGIALRSRGEGKIAVALEGFHG